MKSGAVRRAPPARRRRTGTLSLGLALAGLLSTGWPASLAGQEEDEERTFEPCPVDDPGRVQVGIAGIVRDEESDVPLPGATVLIRYEDRDGLPTPDDLRVETDEEGRYRACGLDAFREIRVRASYSVERGDEREIELDRSQFVDLEVDLGEAAFIVFSVVAAEDGRPVEGARVDFSPIVLAGVTDSLGRVGFRAIPPGTYDVTVEHIGFATREDEIAILSDQTAEMRIELVTQAIAVEPLEVTVTGRDPVLLTTGFYERRGSIEDGYFGTQEEIESYNDLGTLFQFKRELFVRYRRNQLILLNGRPASRLGYDRGNLRELKFSRVRGIEAYRCSEAPPDMLNQVPNTFNLSDCNLIAIWVR
ncbi:MAG: carboxypeptidase-like regulatory domain-containing protein [Gemmatimonadota bacterium]|nr:carboxypeptidase-like regulatory domain-containing protein [Gemmatimonadota bacterium]